jgi:hypothetical protein
MEQEMKSTVGRKKLTWALAILVGALIGVWYLLDSGFCFSKMRYLSDKELITEAIRYNANDMLLNSVEI